MGAGKLNRPRGATRAVALATLLLCGTAPAWAHDSWFAPLPRTDRGEAVFAFGTGNQFPVQEVTIPLTQLQRSGCQGPGQRVAPMRWVADRPVALVLRSARPVPATAALTCWAQLHPIPIEIDDATVEVYLNEISALPAVRERWAALRARGVRFQETYTKVARVELNALEPGAAAAAPSSGGPEAVPGLALDLRVESPLPLRAGDTLRAQLLRDGQPLAGLPLELRSDLSPLGIWRQTDAEGRISVPVPLAANWLLRGVDLRPAEGRPDAWDSRFITLAFEALPRR
ncbi:hypothetical protein D621_05125 [beta proteobacterium AAP51]|nr:hypothetical protein D621_05125 [beta proteobacterium AAP51]